MSGGYFNCQYHHEQVYNFIECLEEEIRKLEDGVDESLVADYEHLNSDRIKLLKNVVTKCKETYRMMKDVDLLFSGDISLQTLDKKRKEPENDDWFWPEELRNG